MYRLCTFLLAVFVLASSVALAQGRRISTFPYLQNFGFVTNTTFAFPTANVDGGEFTLDNTTPQWTSSISTHGLSNNGTGGTIRIQTTSAGPAGFFWHGNFACYTADSLVLSWAKVLNGPDGTALNELRISTNGGSGSVFTELPLSSIEGGAWPTFDNSATPQSGTLRVKLPASLTDAPNTRIRIFAVNVSGTGNHPRVTVDDLSVTGTPIAAPAGTLNSVGNAGNRILTLFMTAGAGADSVLVVRRAGAAPTAVPINGVRYAMDQGLNSTDTVTYLGPAVSGPIRLRGLQPSTNYHFAVYGYRTCNAYYSAAPATGNGTTLDCSGAPDNISGATLLARSQDSITMGYTVGNRTDSVLVVRRLNAAPVLGPANGVRYSVGQGLNTTDTIAYFGPVGAQLAARNLKADSNYTFAIYGYQSCNLAYSPTRALVTGRTYCIGTVGDVADVTVRYTTANNVGLTITQVTNADSYIVFSTGPDTARPRPVSGVSYTLGTVLGDDTVRHIGNNRELIITGLNPGHTYRFAAFGRRECNYAYSALGDSINATTLAACAGGLPGAIDSLRVTRNVQDTLALRWRRAPNATGYLVIARIDSTPVAFPANNTFYPVNHQFGNGAFVLGKTNDSMLTLTGLPQNVAYFIKVVPFRACDLSYGTISQVLPTATRGTAISQRFALRARSQDTIRFGGAVVEFREPVESDGSMLITRRSGQMNTNGIPMFRPNEPTLNLLSTDRWWTFQWVYIGDTTNVNLKFDITGMPGIRDTNDLEIVFRYSSSSAWQDYITSGYQVDSTGRYLVAENRPFLSSDYAIGGNNALNPMPVKLLSFDGHSREGRNILRWRTAEELDNAGFRLYRAPAGSNGSFTLVADYLSDGRLRGAGNSSMANTYGYVDESSELKLGNSYVYRLEEVSLDGSSNEIGRLVLAMEGESRLGSAFRIMPNPVTGSTASIGYVLGEDMPVHVTLVNAVGEVVRVIADEPQAKAGAYSLNVNVADLPAGMYFCRVATGGTVTGYPVTIVR